MMWSEALIASSVWGQENHGGSGLRQRNREGIREERWLGEVACGCRGEGPRLQKHPGGESGQQLTLQ